MLNKFWSVLTLFFRFSFPCLRCFMCLWAFESALLTRTFGPFFYCLWNSCELRNNELLKLDEALSYPLIEVSNTSSSLATSIIFLFSSLFLWCHFRKVPLFFLFNSFFLWELTTWFVIGHSPLSFLGKVHIAIFLLFLSRYAFWILAWSEISN